MGFLFSKPRNKESNASKNLLVTEQDKAVLVLKQQRDKIKQYQKKVTESLEKDRQCAKQLLKDGKTERAKLLLRKKRFMEQAIIKADGQLLNLEKMVQDLEFAEIQKQVANGLSLGNEALKKMHEVLSLEDIEKIMDETQDGIEKQREIDELLSGALTQEDEDAVLSELDEIMAEALPNVPKEENVLPEEEIALPDIPTHEPKEAKKIRREMVAAS